MSFLNELKRRNVLRVGATYIVAAWLIIQVSETIFPLFGYSDTPARLVVIVLAIAFIPSLIFSWVFEITPEGLKRDADVVREQSITNVTGKKLDRIILLVLALALAYFAFDKFVLDPARDSVLVEETTQQARSDALVESYGDKSIAVLPFADMSAEGDQEYMSDGITEELLNLLAKIPELRVISRTSAFSYKGKDINLAEVARQLNVAHILEGSVRKSGDQLRITTQLIDARSDVHLWSETYNRKLEDIFAIQDEVAAQVVEKLKVTMLGATPKVQETDPEAYALYLQAQHLLQHTTPESLKKAVELYKQTLSIDPNYAQAWVNLGVAYSRLASLRLISSEEANRLILDAANRALEIAPNSAGPHSLLAGRLLKEGGKFKDIAYHFQRALTFNPTSTSIIGNVSNYLGKIGRLKDSVDFVEYQVSRDPANAVAHNNLGITYRFIGRLDEAEETLLTVLVLTPTFGGAYYELGVTRLQKKDYSGAVDAFMSEPISVFQKIGMVMAHHALGEDSKSNELLIELIDKYGEKIAYYIAQILSFNGDLDGAFEWLEKARLAGDGELRSAISEPLFANLHTDDRWLFFLEKMGQSPQQLASIVFEVKLPQ